MTQRTVDPIAHTKLAEFFAANARSPLRFDVLREKNALRCEEVFHPIASWSPTDWACAAAGEIGEACNLVKKLRRGETVPANWIADELADAVIYADLLCTRLGMSLEEAIVRKFNAVSDRRGSAVKL